MFSAFMAAAAAPPVCARTAASRTLGGSGAPGNAAAGRGMTEIDNVKAQSG
jgi:hypothetical protein